MKVAFAATDVGAASQTAVFALFWPYGSGPSVDETVTPVAVEPPMFLTTIWNHTDSLLRSVFAPWLSDVMFLKSTVPLVPSPSSPRANGLR